MRAMFFFKIKHNRSYTICSYSYSGQADLDAARRAHEVRCNAYEDGLPFVIASHCTRKLYMSVVMLFLTYILACQCALDSVSYASNLRGRSEC